MADDEYYFDDDGDDQGGDEEETWETAVENKYADAKDHQEKKLDDAVKCYKQVISDDQDKGKWTFKALKGIYRTAAIHKDYDLMHEYYQKMLDFKWSGRGRADIEKAINKHIERTSAFPSEVNRRTYSITIDALAKDLKNHEKLWFNVRLKLAQLALTDKSFSELETMIMEMHEWIGQGEAAEQKHGTQLLNTYSLEIQLHTERYDAKKLRFIYNKAMGVKSAIPAPRVKGIIKESGGKMFMRQSMWQEAFDAFFEAFRAFDEAGDSRRVSCLKYLVLATMLSGSEINPFDTNEAKSYQNDPEIKAMTELINACTKNDVHAFDKVLKDKKNSRSIMEDTFLYSYLEPLVRKIRCQALLVLTKPYKTIRVAYCAKELMMTPKEAENLCVSMILDGKLPAMIDQVKGVLNMSGAGGTKTAAEGETSKKGQEGSYDRHAILQQLLNQEMSLHTSVTQRALA